MKQYYFSKIAGLAIFFMTLSIGAQNSNHLWESVDEAKAKQSEQVFRKISLKTEKRPSTK